MIGTLFEITISMSAVILLLFMLMPFMKKRYSAKLRYYIWLVIALRLCLPFNITLPKAPVKLNMENTSIIPKNIRGENGGKIISETNVTQAASKRKCGKFGKRKKHRKHEKRNSA